MERSEIGDYLDKKIAERIAMGKLVDYTVACSDAFYFPLEDPPTNKPRLLDLGCGVYSKAGRPAHEAWHTPNKCETAHRCGWDVTGIDKFPLGESKPWSFIHGDIMDQDFMHQAFQPGYFDLVYSNLLVSLCSPRNISPSLALPSGQHPYETAKTVFDLQGNTEYRMLLAYFFSEIARVLKPSGIAILNDEYLLQKIGDNLKIRFCREGHIVLPTGNILQQ